MAAPGDGGACSSTAPRPPWLRPRTRWPAAIARCPCPRGTTSTATRCSRRSPRASRPSSSAWAASGAPSASSGRPPACGRPPSATPAATRRTRPTRRSAAAAPATPRPCWSSSTPRRSPTSELLKVFWEGHDPTQGMRQGNDVGTQYRSAIYDRRRPAARPPRRRATLYQPSAARRAGYGAITTEIADAPAFYYAEDYHQQYLAKNPNGYCGIGGTGVSCPVGLGVRSRPDPRSQPGIRPPSPGGRVSTCAYA